MKKVTLPTTDITTSALGFGCSALLGDKTEAEGLGLLHTAFEAGIRYFDVAPMYGYGEAERLVGDFIKGKRQEVIIATKFGIRPMLAIAGASRVRTGVRSLMRFSPAIRGLLGRLARTAVKRGRFGPDEARRSLEDSLRALRTECVDIYLMHECALEDASDGLLSFLSRARDEGKIRYFGIGTEFEQVRGFHQRRPEFTKIVQFQNSVLCQNLAEIGAIPGAVVTHGALAGSYTALTRHLSQRPELVSVWSGRVGADCGQASVLAALMLSYAVYANRQGPVLFQSRRPEFIAANVRAITEGRFSADQLEEFARQAKASGIRPD